MRRTTSGGRLPIFEAELKKVEGLNRVKESHEKVGMDMEKRLVEAEAGMQAAIEQATWSWEDLFKIYVPRVLSKMQNILIPRFIFFFSLFSVYFHNDMFYLELNIRTTIWNSSLNFIFQYPPFTCLYTQRRC